MVEHASETCLPLGLRRGDRLEPSLLLPDVAMVDSMHGAGRLTFWRRSEETLTRHRCPLLTAGLCTMSQCMQVDWLHSMSLGIFQNFLGALFHWLFLDRGLYASRGTRSAIMSLSVQRLEEALFRWYTSQQQQGYHHTPVQRLRVGMFGTSDHPACDLHGSETNGVLLFAVDLLREHEMAGPWLSAAECLKDLYIMIKGHDHIMPPAIIQERLEDQPSTGNINLFCWV